MAQAWAPSPEVGTLYTCDIPVAARMEWQHGLTLLHGGWGRWCGRNDNLLLSRNFDIFHSWWRWAGRLDVNWHLHRCWHLDWHLHRCWDKLHRCCRCWRRCAASANNTSVMYVSRSFQEAAMVARSLQICTICCQIEDLDHFFHLV